MSPESAESVASRYLRAAGQSSDERYQINIDRFAWLVGHCTQLSEVRLGLLRDLQSSLPASGDSDTVAEIKELLTNLIIMATRVSDRNERLSELLIQLADGDELDRVPVDQAALAEAIQAIIQATSLVRAVAGDQP